MAKANLMKIASNDRSYKAAKAKERAAKKAAGVAWRKAMKSAKAKLRRKKK